MTDKPQRKRWADMVDSDESDEELPTTSKPPKAASYAGVAATPKAAKKTPKAAKKTPAAEVAATPKAAKKTPAAEVAASPAVATKRTKPSYAAAVAPPAVATKRTKPSYAAAVAPPRAAAKKTKSSPQASTHASHPDGTAVEASPPRRQAKTPKPPVQKKKKDAKIRSTVNTFEKIIVGPGCTLSRSGRDGIFDAFITQLRTMNTVEFDREKKLTNPPIVSRDDTSEETKQSIWKYITTNDPLTGTEGTTDDHPGRYHATDTRCTSAQMVKDFFELDQLSGDDKFERVRFLVGRIPLNLLLVYMCQETEKSFRVIPTSDIMHIVMHLFEGNASRVRRHARSKGLTEPIVVLPKNEKWLWMHRKDIRDFWNDARTQEVFNMVEGEESPEELDSIKMERQRWIHTKDIYTGTDKFFDTANKGAVVDTNIKIVKFLHVCPNHVTNKAMNQENPRFDPNILAVRIIHNRKYIDAKHKTEMAKKPTNIPRFEDFMAQTAIFVQRALQIVLRDFDFMRMKASTKWCPIVWVLPVNPDSGVEKPIPCSAHEFQSILIGRHNPQNDCAAENLQNVYEYLYDSFEEYYSEDEDTARTYGDNEGMNDTRSPTYGDNEYSNTFESYAASYPSLQRGSRGGRGSRGSRGSREIRP